MTTTNDGGPDPNNAGPVLPEAPELRVKLAETLHMTWSQARECDQNIRADIEAYGRQCWNACDEHVAGPLRKRVAELERENAVLAESIALGPGTEAVKSVSDELDRLRAENEALRKFIAEYRRAAIACMNTVIQTRGCDGMDGLANANDKARNLLASIDAARAAREG